MSRVETRVRVVQIGGLVVVVVLSLAAIASALTAYEVRGLSGDVERADSHLPATIESRLASSGGGMLDSNQITLVSYGSGIARGTSVLFATAPSHQFSSIMSISPGVRIGSSRHLVLKNPDHPRRHLRYRVQVGMPLRTMTTKQTITAFRSAGIPITHVALINAQNVGPLVNAVGGITVSNRTAFSATAHGQPVDFPVGTLHLDGPHAATYVHAATTRESLDTAENAALVGIVHAVLAPSGVDRLRSVGSALAGATATDLTPADVIGLVDMRIRGGDLVNCRLAGPGNLADPRLKAIVNQALGRTATSGPACRSRHLAAAPVVPPTMVVKAVQHYGWQLFAGLAIVLGVVSILLAALLKARWPTVRAYP